MNSTKMAFEIIKLSYTYAANTPAATYVLHDINLKIPKGDFVAIMGASGSGKSTLMKYICKEDRTKQLIRL